MKGAVLATAKLTLTMTNEQHDPNKFDLSVFCKAEGVTMVQKELQEIIESELNETVDGWVQTAMVTDVNVEVIEE